MWLSAGLEGERGGYSLQTLNQFINALSLFNLLVREEEEKRVLWMREKQKNEIAVAAAAAAVEEHISSTNSANNL